MAVIASAPARGAAMTGAPGLAARDGRDIAILDAAVSVASVGGYEAVRMRAVAESAGIAVGSIYRRFPSKAYLLVCALTREVEQVEALRDWSAVPGGPQQRLVALSDCLHEQWQRDLPLTEALTRALVVADSAAAAEVERTMTVLNRLLAAALGGPSPSLRDQQLACLLGDVWLANLAAFISGRVPAAAARDSIDRAMALILRV